MIKTNKSKRREFCSMAVKSDFRTSKHCNYHFVTGVFHRLELCYSENEHLRHKYTNDIAGLKKKPSAGIHP